LTPKIISDKSTTDWVVLHAGTVHGAHDIHTEQIEG